jgi:hypothetical protein
MQKIPRIHLLSSPHAVQLPTQLEHFWFGPKLPRWGTDQGKNNVNDEWFKRTRWPTISPHWDVKQDVSSFVEQTKPFWFYQAGTDKNMHRILVFDPGLAKFLNSY